MVPMRKDQSVRAAPLAVQVKVVVLPDKDEPAKGVRKAGLPLPLLLVVLALAVLGVLEVLLVALPEPAPAVY